ncbi:Phenylacetate--CoA ligase [Caldicellulosiruptor saccharolyticus DSM 8903]|uniref:Phenylacetate-coenzyme A ligase n=1 Tax=Caldicellulosiruptor saccharolyticus (strain ATCC 43494 / DSM 8903 / Tp8T 6331) TaxID=351627 RepID=A4XLB2_CALS8|nr:phenylacetate--CoA ligase [Caldicellulosiruptor saccharolyticus]ABP67697.1 Phenylacetate--CoA ligase [Caldicellulosiruptor saccharolyticus DSM 8903]
MDRVEMREVKEELFLQQIKNAYENSPFYRRKYQELGIDVDDIKHLADIKKLPFTTKEELREAYPLGLASTDERKIVRIHSSSGTTGVPVIIPYTQKDIDDWKEMMKRCYQFAGVTELDRVQITPAYGLWTAGIGFQLGAEYLGAMVIPMGPGNTEKQLQMMMDLKSTVLVATSSYGLLLAEEVIKKGLKDKIHLRVGIFGSERWGEKQRRIIEEYLGIETFDIYGLTEIYGPGIAIDCKYHDGLHYFDDYLYFEVIDPQTGQDVPDGEFGELVITTLQKEGAPLIRYRTRDITRKLPGMCQCGSTYPRIDRIVGRTDDMVKVKGVNIFPAQIDTFLKDIKGVGSEYQVVIERIGFRDKLTLKVEVEDEFCTSSMKDLISNEFKNKIGVSAEIILCRIGELPRSEKKTKRIFDLRG